MEVFNIWRCLIYIQGAGFFSPTRLIVQTLHPHSDLIWYLLFKSHVTRSRNEEIRDCQGIQLADSPSNQPLQQLNRTKQNARSSTTWLTKAIAPPHLVL